MGTSKVPRFYRPPRIFAADSFLVYLDVAKFSYITQFRVIFYFLMWC